MSQMLPGPSYTDSSCECGRHLCGASTHIFQTSLASRMSPHPSLSALDFFSATDVAGSHVAHIQRQPRSVGVVIYPFGGAHCGKGADK